MKSKLLITSFAFISLTTCFAQATSLKPKALECYKQALSDDSILNLNKFSPYFSKKQIDLEKIARDMCTYSDAVGSKRCYEQALSDDAVLTNIKNSSIKNSDYELIAANLCRNSYELGFNKATGEADAVECVKAAMSDKDVLTASKEFDLPVNQEKLAIKLCISSNALGAITCYKDSVDKAKKILEQTSEYSGPVALDNAILDMCKGSRLR